jgi:hypothetical protein
MSTLSTLTIFYTQNLHGNLKWLPGLHTFIVQQKHQLDAHALLIDLGGSCAPDVWHCAATQGRSTLIVLDAMGFHAANVLGVVEEAQREPLRTTLSTGLLDERRSWRYAVPPIKDLDIVVATMPVPALKLCIVAAPAERTWLENRTLQLHSLEPNTVGLVQVDLTKQQILRADALTPPNNLRPDPTISATVDFVEEEARFYQRQKGQ